VKYLVNTNPPPSASARSEMDARVKAALRFVVG